MSGGIIDLTGDSPPQPLSSDENDPTDRERSRGVETLEARGGGDEGYSPESLAGRHRAMDRLPAGAKAQEHVRSEILALRRELAEKYERNGKRKFRDDRPLYSSAAVQKKSVQSKRVRCDAQSPQSSQTIGKKLAKSTEVKMSSSQFEDLFRRFPAVDRAVLRQLTACLPFSELEAHLREQFSTSVPEYTQGFARQMSTRSSQNTDSAVESLKVLSYNIWFAPVKMEARMRCIAKEIKRLDADIIGLQEVIHESLFVLKILLGDSYEVYTQDNRCPYFCALLIHKRHKTRNVHYTPFQSFMGRGLLSCEVQMSPTFWLSVGTVHLESYNDRTMTGSRERPIQLSQATLELSNSLSRTTEAEQCGAVRACILIGDFNWKDPGKRAKNDGDALTFVRPATPNAWRDAWREVKKGDPGFTYDGKRNGMLANNFRQRLDRCFVRGLHLVTAHADLVGTGRVEPYATYEKTFRSGRIATLPIFPSDHFGLLVEFLVKHNSV